RRGSLVREVVRHGHQAMKPENLKPRILATPVRRPMAANWPMVLKTKGVFASPLMAAAMFRPRILPWRNACCAVGGYGLPVFLSGTEAQSHRAQTPGYPET